MNKLLLQLIITVVTSAVICMILIPLIIRASLRFNLVDKPDERKVHIKPIPRLGGVGIFISTIMGIIVSGRGLEAIAIWPVLFTSMAILFLIGIWDDLKNISAKLRFVLQICCAVALASTGIRLTSLYGIFGVHELNAFSQYAVSVLIMVGVTNSFNLIDGIDGLAGGLALISMMVLGFLSYKLQLYPLLIVFVAFIGSLIGFLKNNISPAKIFMGDGGSLVLGYLLSATGILLIEKAHANPTLITPEQAATLVTAILIIPVFDTVRVFASRIRKGFSPFKADKTHIHHLFLVAGMNHRKTTGILCSFEGMLILLAVVLPNAAGISIAILIMVFLFHIITLFLRINQGMEEWLKIVKKMEKEGIV
jgi:UDP-GlcNAc:undecaprenyl-phosphate/decaprenyl-phosphate GlcNAc-1-phosphate transferase